MSTEDQDQPEQVEQNDSREVTLDLSLEEVGVLALADRAYAVAWLKDKGIKAGQNVIVGGNVFTTDLENFFDRDRDATEARLANLAREAAQRVEGDETLTEDRRDVLEVEMADTGLEAIATEGNEGNIDLVKIPLTYPRNAPLPSSAFPDIEPKQDIVRPVSHPAEGEQTQIIKTETVFSKDEAQSIKGVTNGLMDLVQRMSANPNIDRSAKEAFIDKQIRIDLEQLQEQFTDKTVSKEKYALLMSSMLGAGSRGMIDQIVGELHGAGVFEQAEMKVVEQYATQLKALAPLNAEAAQSSRAQIMFVIQQEQSRLINPDRSVSDARYFILAGIAAGTATGLSESHARDMMHGVVNDAFRIKIA